MMRNKTKYIPCPRAGSWYPGTASQIERFIDQHRRDMSAFKDKAWKGFIVPHAGWRYSGPTALVGYTCMQSLLTGDTRILLLAPSHQIPLRKAVTITTGDYLFQTPIGSVPVLGFSGASHDFFEHGPEVLGTEHSIEVQMPFLRFISGGRNPVLPVMLGRHSLAYLRSIADHLRKFMADLGQWILIASSDLSHFHSAYEAETLDQRILPLLRQSMNERDIHRFWHGMEGGIFEACGSMAIATMSLILLTAEDGVSWDVVEFARTHSGNMTGDHSSVVGYLSAGIAAAAA